MNFVYYEIFINQALLLTFRIITLDGTRISIKEVIIALLNSDSGFGLLKTELQLEKKLMNKVNRQASLLV